jgi:ATP-dependent DNA helicase DinG
MFVLFTSHRDIRAMAAELRSRGIERRWPLLVHGDETRDTLLDRFRDAGKAILLGTASFWEGVDVPGDALHALLIAKLPFKVPTEPITAAHFRTPRCVSSRASAGWCEAASIEGSW